MLQKISSVFVVYRRKTLTGSPDPTHAIGTDKPCTDPFPSVTIDQHWPLALPLTLTLPLTLGVFYTLSALVVCA